MYAPQPQNDPNDDTGPDGLRQAGAGASLLTTTDALLPLLEADALTQARRAIAQAETSHAAALDVLETIAEAHVQPPIAAAAAANALLPSPTTEHFPPAQTGHEIVNTLHPDEQQKQSVDGMIALLMQQSQAARRRRASRWTNSALMIMGCLLLLWGGTFSHNLFLLFNLVGGWWAVEHVTKRRETSSDAGQARAVGTPEPIPTRYDLSLGDPRTVGALAVALRGGDRSIQQTASEALFALLPRVRASHAAHVTPDQMNALLELAFSSNSPMQIAVLQALEQIGDQRAIPLVQNLALSPHKAVRDQANQCLPFLTQRARQAEQSATLLRGAASPGATAGGRELLRPATSTTANAPRADELLRSADAARSGC